MDRLQSLLYTDRFEVDRLQSLLHTDPFEVDRLQSLLHTHRFEVDRLQSDLLSDQFDRRCPQFDVDGNRFALDKAEFLRREGETLFAKAQCSRHCKQFDLRAGAFRVANPMIEQTERSNQLDALGFARQGLPFLVSSEQLRRPTER